MLFLASYTPHPVAFSYEGFSVYWYAVFITLGAVLGYALFSFLARERGVKENDVLDLALWALVAGFLGARLYHVLNEVAYYTAHPGEVFAIWHGGLAIHGGILAGALVFWYIARRRSLPFLTLLDTVAPGLLLGQAIGRWGNYFNQELFGGPTTLPWKLFIAPEHRPETYAEHMYFHPTFLYESLGLLTLVLCVFLLRKRFTVPGTLAFLAIALAQILRAATELLRIDQTPHILGMRLPLLVSLLFAAFAIYMCILIKKRHGLSRIN